MKMSANSQIKARPLRENLKKRLIKHFFLKILQVESISIIAVMLILLSWGMFQAQRENEKAVWALEEAVGHYDNFLADLSRMDSVIVPKNSSIWRHGILKKFYGVSLQTKLAADLYILNDERQVTASNREDISAEEQTAIVLQWEIIDKIHRHPQELQIVVSKGKEKKLFLGRAVADGQHLDGYLILRIAENEWKKIFAELPLGIVITDEDYWAIYSDQLYFVDNIGRLKEGLRGQNAIVFFGNEIYARSVTALKSLPLRVHALFDYTEILKVLGIVLATSLIILFFLLWVGRANVDTLALDFTGDIGRLEQAFSEATLGNLKIELDLHSSEELENIGNGFQAMIDSLKRQMTRNRELAEMVAYEQIKQLKSQFKSHFLFNTLDNIRYICRISPELAENMIVQLSKLLRYHTADRHEKVTLAEDLEYLEMYFAIIKIRFGEAFAYSVELDKGLENCLVLKLLLQPLVENAIKYGFEKKESIFVRVCAKKVGEDMVLTCQDTGGGIAEEMLQKIQKNLGNAENQTVHLGLYNMNRRVQLAYGAQYGLSLRNDSGLVAAIRLPIEKEEALK